MIHVASPFVDAFLALVLAVTIGTATWYDGVRGQAAAGPDLRAMLGRNWRGSTVRVCHWGRCITVRLTDWCQCLNHTSSERIIDLDDRDFAYLSPLSQGVMTVKVVAIP